MGFIKSAVSGNDQDDPDADLEEQYKRLMPKIGRDFVTIDDLKELMDSMMILIDPLGLNPSTLGNSHARDLADRYVKLVDKGKDGGEQKRDLAYAKEPKEKDDF